MKRSQLTEALSLRFKQFTLADSKAAVDTIIEALTEALAGQSRIEIRGFGSFKLYYRPPRTGRNPMTGAPVQVPAKASIRFKMGKELQERVDRSKP